MVKLRGIRQNKKKIYESKADRSKEKDAFLQFRSLLALDLYYVFFNKGK